MSTSLKDVERAVVGSILINPDCIWRVAPLVNVEDFYWQACRTIYETLLRMAKDGKTIDLLTVKDELQRNDMLDRIGGSAYFSGFVDHIPDIANVETYATIVAKDARLRRIEQACKEAIKRTESGSGEPAEIVADLVTDVSLSIVGEDKGSFNLGARLIEIQDQLEETSLIRREVEVLTSGFVEMDHRRIFRPTLVELLGPSSHGKSALMFNVMLGIAQNMEHGASVMYSMEMMDRECGDRLLAMLSGVPHAAIRDWYSLEPERKRRVRDAAEWLKRHKHTILFTYKLRTVDAIYVDLRRLKSTHDVKIAFVDYIQAMRGARSEEVLANMGADLLEIAQELNICIVAGSQVNKDRRNRGNGRLSIDDSKYSAAFAESARACIMVQRPWQDDKSTTEFKECHMLCQIEKNSEGGTVDYELHFDTVTQRIVEQSPSARVRCRKCSDGRMF